MLVNTRLTSTKEENWTMQKTINIGLMSIMVSSNISDTSTGSQLMEPIWERASSVPYMVMVLGTEIFLVI